MKLTRNLRFNPALINLVPLVNVCFLVVVFFALSSRFVLQPGLAVTLPISGYTLGPQNDSQIITVSASPTPAIYFRDEKVTLEELGKRLAEGRGKARTLILKADRAAAYDIVFQIMDLGARHGFAVVLAAESERR